MSTLTTLPDRGQLGQGIYSLADLRLYLAYDGAQDDGRVLAWLGAALNPVAHKVRQPDYSFSDLVSLFVVRRLTAFGVRSAQIREAEARMRGVRGIDRPFVSEDIATDGVEVFFATEGDQIESANLSTKRRTGQQASRTAIAPYLHQVRYQDGAATSWAPADHVRLDPTVQFGDPTVDGSRVPTAAVADMARHASVAEVAQRLGLDLEAAEAAVRFERRLAGLRN